MPCADASHRDRDIAGPFLDGSHFRVDGLEVLLIGAKPKKECLKRGCTSTRITISTSGVYADIRDGKIFHFTSLPMRRRFEYYMKEDGEKKGLKIRSRFQNSKHVQPTAFTQWAVKLEEPDFFDLSGLTDVQLKWTGTAYFE